MHDKNGKVKSVEMKWHEMCASVSRRAGKAGAHEAVSVICAGPGPAASLGRCKVSFHVTSQRGCCLWRVETANYQFH